MTYYVIQITPTDEFTSFESTNLAEAIKKARFEDATLSKTEKKTQYIEVFSYEAGDVNKAEEIGNYDGDSYVWGLTNKNYVIERVADLLKKIELYPSGLKSDIYLYVDKKGVGEVKIYESTGNSWLNDDHYTIYSDTSIHNKRDIFNIYSTLDDIADGLGVSVDELKQMVDIDEDDDEDDILRKVYDYICDDDESYGKLVDDMMTTDLEDEYLYKAEQIIDDFYDELLHQE